MAKETKVNVQTRTTNGSSNARRLRLTGKIPAIVYNRQRETLPVQLDAHEFGMLLQRHGENMILRLMVEGNGEKTVLMKDVQHAPVSGALLHVDFMEISMTELLEAPVRIELVGESAGVKLGGILEQLLNAIQVRCLPMDLPEVVAVDISDMVMGAHLVVGDIKLPEGVVATTPADALVASVMAPRTLEEAAPAAVEGAPAPELVSKKKAGEEAEAEA